MCGMTYIYEHIIDSFKDVKKSLKETHGLALLTPNKIWLQNAK